MCLSEAYQQSMITAIGLGSPSSTAALVVSHGSSSCRPHLRIGNHDDLLGFPCSEQPFLTCERLRNIKCARIIPATNTINSCHHIRLHMESIAGKRPKDLSQVNSSATRPSAKMAVRRRNRLRKNPTTNSGTVATHSIVANQNGN